MEERLSINFNRFSGWWCGSGGNEKNSVSLTPYICMIPDWIGGKNPIFREKGSPRSSRGWSEEQACKGPKNSGLVIVDVLRKGSNFRAAWQQCPGACVIPKSNQYLVLPKDRGDEFSKRLTSGRLHGRESLSIIHNRLTFNKRFRYSHFRFR